MNRSDRSRQLKTLRQTLKEFRCLKEPSISILRKAPRGILSEEGSLGIFPACFNPPTKAHVALIREARKQAHLDEILVLLDLQAMDKKLTGASWEDRIPMLEAVFRRDPKVSIGISNRGLFMEKIEPLKQIYPASVEFTFIVGFDTIIRVMDKKYYKNRKKSLNELFGQCRFLVANREDRERIVFEIFFQHRENERYKSRVSFFNLPINCSFISSSLVRERIRRGRQIHHLVPLSVHRNIREKRLYKKGD